MTLLEVLTKKNRLKMPDIFFHEMYIAIIHYVHIIFF